MSHISKARFNVPEQKITETNEKKKDEEGEMFGKKRNIYFTFWQHEDTEYGQTERPCHAQYCNTALIATKAGQRAIEKKVNQEIVRCIREKHKRIFDLANEMISTKTDVNRVLNDIMRSSTHTINGAYGNEYVLIVN